MPRGFVKANINDYNELKTIMQRLNLLPATPNNNALLLPSQDKQ